MRATIKLKDLKKATDYVSVCVPTRSAIPVLTGILIEAVGNTMIKITSNDIEMGVIAKCPAHIEERTSVVLPGKLFIGIIRSMVGEDVIIRTKTDNVTAEIECGKSKYTLSGYPPENFPVFPPFSEEEYFTMNCHQLRTGFNQTTFAASIDETRGSLTGVLVEKKENLIFLAATDGHRLSLHKIKYIDNFIKDQIQFILPSRTASTIMRAMVGEVVKIVPGKGEILFDMGEVMVFSRLLEGEFPEYEAILPNEFIATITVDRKLFVEAVERVALVTTPEEETIYFHFEDSKLIMTCESQGLGTASEEIEVEAEGKALDMAFNSHFLIEGIRVAPWKKIILGLNSAVSPVLLFGETDEFRHLIMPLKVQREE